MKNHLNKLSLRHRQLDRKIDTTQAAGMQEELKALKRLRLNLKDRITALKQSRTSVTQ